MSSLKNKLKTIRTSIYHISDTAAKLSDTLDDRSFMRVYRDELANSAVAMAYLSENYPQSELSIAYFAAKVITSRDSSDSVSDSSGMSVFDNDKFPKAGRNLLALGLHSLCTSETASKSNRIDCNKTNTKIKKLADVKKYFATIGMKNITIRVKDSILYVHAGKKVVAKMASCLGRIKKKMKSMGFSDVLIKI